MKIRFFKVESVEIANGISITIHNLSNHLHFKTAPFGKAFQRLFNPLFTHSYTDKVVCSGSMTTSVVRIVNGLVQIKSRPSIASLFVPALLLFGMISVLTAEDFIINGVSNRPYYYRLHTILVLAIILLIYLALILGIRNQFHRNVRTKLEKDGIIIPEN